MIVHKFEKYNEVRDCIDHRFVEFLNWIGFHVLLMPNSLKNPYDFLSDHTPDGIVLSGGNDINPLLYGKELISLNRNVSDERDQAETKIIEYAILNELPLLGVCRGAQMINVHFGGSLIQDLTNHRLNTINHVGTKHTVKFNNSFFFLNRLV